MKLKTPTSSDVKNKTVLMRVDYNVPLEDTDNRMKIADDRRIRASLKTLQFLLENNAKVILVSHLGRPKSAKDGHLSLEPIAQYLKKKLNQPITFVDAVTGPKIESAVQNLQPGAALLLENLRFHEGEKKNSKSFARDLASLADLYVNEAFSTAHRTHASTVGVTEHLPSFAGFALKEEVKHLSGLLENPKRPLVIVLGGAKISDKVGAVKHFSDIADIVLVGGAVANNFLKAEGLEVYRSYIEDTPAETNKEEINYVQFAQDLLQQHKTEHMLKDGYIPLPKILYPIDVVAAPNMETDDASNTEIVDLTHDMEDTEENIQLAYYDIGPKTIKLYGEILANAGTIFWNGPMGVWENELFATGTKQVAHAIAQNPGSTVVGGGDTIAAIDHFGLESKFKYVSAAGGAALDFLSEKMLPGIEPLRNHR